MKILWLIVALMSFSATAQEQPNSQVMPDWQLKTQDGQLVKSQELLGRPVMLHFWATWCPYCKRLQPGLDKLQKKYAKAGLYILAISFNEEPGAKPQDELKSRGLDLHTLVEGEELAQKFGVVGTPTTVFIGPDGTILGSTMQSDPNDPQWDEVASYLVTLPNDLTLHK